MAELVPILMYHQISGPQERPNRLGVTEASFESQLALLRDEGYSSVTASDLEQAMRDGSPALPSKPVVITFDDGYEDFHSRAMPLLSKYGFTATIFVTTKWMRDSPGSGTEGMLSWDQLSEAAAAGIEIGGHTCTHPQLDTLPEERVRDELYASKASLEDKLGFGVSGLAYPYGYSSAKVRRVAREVGYGYAHAVDNSMASSAADPFAVPRLTVQRGTTLEVFGRLVRGGTTLAVRRDRAMTRGWSVVRRSRSALAAGRA